MCSSFPARAPKLLNNHNRRTLKLKKKKDNLHPKTKKKPQQDGRRGTITIKSNPTSYGWVTTD